MRACFGCEKKVIFRATSRKIFIQIGSSISGRSLTFSNIRADSRNANSNVHNQILGSVHKVVMFLYHCVKKGELNMKFHEKFPRYLLCALPQDRKCEHNLQHWVDFGNLFLFFFLLFFYYHALSRNCFFRLSPPSICRLNILLYFDDEMQTEFTMRP